MIFLQLDLSNFDSIQKFVNQFLSLNLPLHVLINNASVFALSNFSTNEENIEMQFMVNYLGHFLLTSLLIPKLLQNVPSRVICVSSSAHFYLLINNKFNLKKIPQSMENYNSLQSYGLSKLALIMFMYQLSKKYGKQGLYGISCHPGLIKTDITQNHFIIRNLIKVSISHKELIHALIKIKVAPQCITKSLEEGALNVVSVKKNIGYIFQISYSILFNN